MRLDSMQDNVSAAVRQLNRFDTSSPANLGQSMFGVLVEAPRGPLVKVNVTMPNGSHAVVTLPIMNATANQISGYEEGAMVVVNTTTGSDMGGAYVAGVLASKAIHDTQASMSGNMTSGFSYDGGTIPEALAGEVGQSTYVGESGYANYTFGPGVVPFTSGRSSRLFTYNPIPKKKNPSDPNSGDSANYINDPNGWDHAIESDAYSQERDQIAKFIAVAKTNWVGVTVSWYDDFKEGTSGILSLATWFAPLKTVFVVESLDPNHQGSMQFVPRNGSGPGFIEVLKPHPLRIIDLNAMAFDAVFGTHINVQTGEGGGVYPAKIKISALPIMSKTPKLAAAIEAWETQFESLVGEVPVGQAILGQQMERLNRLSTPLSAQSGIPERDRIEARIKKIQETLYKLIIQNDPRNKFQIAALQTELKTMQARLLPLLPPGATLPIGSASFTGAMESSMDSAMQRYLKEHGE